MLKTLLVEDNAALRRALKIGLEATGDVQVAGEAASGEEALDLCLASRAHVDPDGRATGRRDERHPGGGRHPARVPAPASRLLLHPGRRRLLPRLFALRHAEPLCVRAQEQLPLAGQHRALLRDAAAGRSFIDPEIEARVQEVRHKDEYDPLALLEPNERQVVALAGTGVDQRADRCAAGFPRQARRQPHQRPDLCRLGPDRQRHRREGGPHAGGASSTTTARPSCGTPTAPPAWQTSAANGCRSRTSWCAIHRRH